MSVAKTLIILGLSFMIAAYQNCGGGFQGGAAESSSTSANEAALLREKAMQVLNDRCVSCHSPSVASGGVDVTDESALLYYRYVVPGEPQLSPLFNLIQEGEMPPGDPLSANEAQAISDWILSGMIDAQNPAPPASGELKATYSSLAANVLGPHCVSCHSGASASAGISLDSYMGVKNIVRVGDPASSALYTSVATRKTMPKGAAPLSAAQISAVKTWIEQGAMNN